jgi:Xaa-Pro dipeptidase
MLFNKSRAVEFMRNCDLDVLIATSPINITYFSGYHCWLDPLFKGYMMIPGGSSDLIQGYALFPLRGEPALVVSPLFLVNALDSWVQDLYTYGSYGPDDSIPPANLSKADKRIYDLTHPCEESATPTEALIKALKDRGLKDARIGLEMEGLTSDSIEIIEQMLTSAEVRDCSNLIRLIRMVKSTEELSRLRHAAEINEEAAMQAMALSRPGMRAAEVVKHFRHHIAERGADYDHFAFGVRGQGIATETDYCFSENEVTYVDFGCIYKHYFSDGGTTLAMCQLPPELKKRYEAIKNCIRAGEENIRPGVKASNVRNAMWAILEQRGFTASFPHGHGLGLEVRDYPIIVEDNGLHIKDECIQVPSDLSLEADMVVNLESVMFMPGIGSVHMERSLQITVEGCRPLVYHDRTLPVMPDCF